MLRKMIVAALLAVLWQSSGAQVNGFPAEAQLPTEPALRQALAGKVFKALPSDGNGWRMEFKDGGYVYLNTDLVDACGSQRQPTSALVLECDSV